ncbi:MAG: DUF4340 domain-containing protein [Oligoflexales bacterium]
MKSYRTPLILGLVLLALGGVAFWDEKKTKEEEKLNATKNKLFEVTKEDVLELTYLNSGKTPPENVTLKKQDNTWFITSPVDAKADQTAVNNLIDNIATFQFEKEITADKAKHGEFGLANPTTTVTFVAAGKKHSVYVGDKPSVGYSVYLRVDEDPKVYLGSQVLATATEKTLRDLREKSLAQIDQDSVTKVTLDNAVAKEVIALEKKDGTWNMTQPSSLEADASQVTGLLSGLTGENVETFHDKPDASLVKTAAEPKNRIADVSWVTSAGAATTLKIWQANSKFYAAYDPEKVIFEVAADIKDKVNKKAEDFRNRKVFKFSSPTVQKIMIDGQSFVQEAGKWVKERAAKEGAKQPAENIPMFIVDLEYANAEGFVEKEQLKSYGPPLHTVELAFGEKVRKDNLKIDFWVDPADKEKVILSHSDTDLVYLLPKSVLANISMEKASTSKIDLPAKEETKETL